MKDVIIAPSILSADLSKLYDECKDLKKYGATYLHFDVMDGHFVPNISFGKDILKSLKDRLDFVYDCHLMIEDPKKYFKGFIESGADIITFHYEVFKSDEEIISFIKELKENKVRAGISIKPNTKVEVLDKLLPYLDLILIMSVEPGFGGQTFIPSALDKIKYLDNKRKENNYKYLIEVDGGINLDTSKLCKDMGCDILVAGSFIFKAKDRKKVIETLKG